ncbi:catalase, partial [Pseudonocardia sp. KRD291]|uniref:catalase n=1 Tax=Pseudonocardia sp. KRD291 TaxID=2792007 RepID=UPI001C4A4961
SGESLQGLSPGSAPPSVPTSGAGPATVALSDDAAGHPAATLVLEQIQLYFNAINNRDYPTWTQVVTDERAAQQPRDEWLRGVGSTTDGTIRVDRITDLSQGRVLALVRFVSVQNPADGPDGLKVGRICWRASLPMAGSPPRLEVGEAGSTLGAPC